MEEQKPFICISGPTASGKTRLAIELGRFFPSEIINIDSVQCYKELDIGSAKPSEEEQRVARHHLLDIFTPETQASVGEYLEALNQVLTELKSRDTAPLLVGGSTMYLEGALCGFSPLPPRDESFRRELSLLSSESLHKQLQSVSPERALELHPNDRVRIERALEIFEAMGTCFVPRDPPLISPAIVIIPCWKRDVLYERINKRSEEMLAGGFIEEVRSLLHRYGKDAPALKSVGYQEVRSFLEGGLRREELADGIAQATRRYAKRQLVFWRNAASRFGWQAFPCKGKEESSSFKTVHRGGERHELSGRSKEKGILCYQMTVEELVQFCGVERSGTSVLFVDAERMFLGF